MHGPLAGNILDFQGRLMQIISNHILKVEIYIVFIKLILHRSSNEFELKIKSHSFVACVVS